MREEQRAMCRMVRELMEGFFGSPENEEEYRTWRR